MFTRLLLAYTIPYTFPRGVGLGPGYCRMKPILSTPKSGSKLRKARGTCSVCHNIRKLHKRDGRVHLHGPRVKPCLGSRQQPLATLRLPAGSTSDFLNEECPGAPQITAEETQPSAPETTNSARLCDLPTVGPELSKTMQHPLLQRRLLRHIPKGARSGAGHLLTKIIEAILKEPHNVEAWRCLLAFGAGSLEVPSKGGRRRSLTLPIKRRIASFYDRWPILNETIFSPPTDARNQRKSPTLSSNQTLAEAVAAKLEDGNITAAAHILCSDDAPAPINEETLELLRQKHPAPPLERPTLLRPTTTPLQISEAEIRSMMRSFPKGSSGGPDGLRPQHVSELLGDPDSGPGLLRAMTALVNLLLAGTCPQEIRTILFGGTLFALRKSSGGLRPIAIGYTWRRLASKCANAYAIPKVTSFLSPKQLGVGVPGGCEAAIHATRRFLGSMNPDSILVKLDLSNAFNSLHLLRPRSVSVSVLAIRDLRTSSLRTDPSTSGATPKLVTGGWSGFFAKSKFTSGPTIRDSITMSWPSLMISLPSISPGPRRNVISPAIEFNVVLRQIGVGSSHSASSSIAVIDLSCRVADLFNNR